PDLAMERVLLFQDMSDIQYFTLVEQHVAALNKALEGIPADRVRLHVCWGNWEGPHVHDVAMEVILPALYQANVGALGLEFANPRRQHEVAALRKYKLPDSMILIPGVIDPKSNFVEHPEVVGAAHRDGGGRCGRPRARNRWRRLRFRHFRRLGMGHRGCGVGQAGDVARRSRHRFEAAMEPEGGLSPAVCRQGLSYSRQSPISARLAVPLAAKGLPTAQVVADTLVPAVIAIVVMLSLRWSVINGRSRPKQTDLVPDKGQ